MTSYKKMAQEAEDKLQESMHQIDVLRGQLEVAQRGLFEELSMHLDNEEAKEVLRIFSDRIYCLQFHPEVVHTPEGTQSLKGGDWIVQDEDGKYWAYDNKAFMDIYEEVKDGV